MKRYGLNEFGDLYEAAGGYYCEHKDVEALEAENKRLTEALAQAEVSINSLLEITEHSDCHCCKGYTCPNCEQEQAVVSNLHKIEQALKEQK